MTILDKNGNCYRFADGSTTGPNKISVMTWAKDYFKTDRLSIKAMDGMGQRWSIQAY